MMSLEGWQSVTIEDCCEILDHKRVPVNSEEREKRIGTIPYYGANGLQGYIDDFIFNEDLILIAEDGGNFSEFATRPIAYRISGKSWVNNHAHVLRAKAGFVQDTIFYFLEHKDIQQFIVGGTRAKLNQSELRSITLYLPKSKQEQAQIAAILSTIDKAIEQTEAIIAKQQRIKTGLMQDLLTRGIDEVGNLRSEETHEFKDSPLGRIPVEWEVAKLQDVAFIIDPNPSHRYPPSSDVGVPMVSTENFSGENGYDLSSCERVPFETFETQQKRCKFKATDIVFARKGRLGFSRPYGYQKKVFSHTVVILKPCDNRLQPEYLLLLVRSREFFKQIDKRMNSNSGVPTLGVAFLGAVPVHIPKTQEQKKVCAIINKLGVGIEKEEQNLLKLQKIKTGLMQDLLTGKVRVTDLLNQQER